MNSLLKTHSLELNHNIFKLGNLFLKISNNVNKQNFNTEIFDIVNKYKQNIDDIDKFSWDKIKLIVNDFETIYSKEVSTSTYIPISRAYFKFWEILNNFKIIDIEKNANILCLAEGPGGFIEAIHNYFKQNSKNQVYSTCMTLISDDKLIPDWKKASFFFKCNKNIDLVYGKDNTGNLYNTDNIRFLFKKFCDKKVDLVTADGGFDYSINYNTQEQTSYKLIFCEIICGLGCLKLNGNIVIKVFDIHTEFTLNIIYFLTKYFKKIYINKPVTSRNLNSEKYLICVDFLGIENSLLERFLILINNWNDIEKKKKFVTNIFTFNVPQDFKNLIYNYNLIYSKYNVYNIIKALTYIKLGMSYNCEKYIRQNQLIKSSFWCYKYNITINYKLEELNKEYQLITND